MESNQSTESQQPRRRGIRVFDRPGRTGGLPSTLVVTILVILALIILGIIIF